MNLQKIFFVILTITTVNSFSQDCPFDLNKTDPFNGERELRISTKYNEIFTLGLYRKGDVYRFESNINMIGNLSFFLPADSKMDLKLGNGKVLTLSSVKAAAQVFNNEYENTSYGISYTISEEQLVEIADVGVQYIRTHLQGEEYYDYEMKKNEIEEIKSNASCILYHQVGKDVEKKTIASSGYYELFGMGIGIPVGDFASKSVDAYGGYAYTGFNLNFSGGIPIKQSNFGIAWMCSGFINAFDINSYVNKIQSNDVSKINGITTTYEVIPGTHPDYTGTFIMSGLFATYPVNIFSFDFRAMGGLMISHLPPIHYTATAEAAGGYFWMDSWSIPASTATSFAYDFGVDFRVNPLNKYVYHKYHSERAMALILGIDYISASPRVNTTQESTFSGMNSYYNTYANYTNKTTVVRSFPISMLTISIGAALSFR